MTSNEALRTQLDNLQWEVDRLDAENSKLQSLDEAAGRCVDLEGELVGARKEVTALGERVKALEAELIQSAKGAETAVQKAEAAEAEVYSTRAESGTRPMSARQQSCVPCWPLTRNR